MTMHLESLPQRRHDVELREQGGDSVLTTPTGELFALNPTARAIWELCDGHTTVDELAAAIAEVFVIDEPTAHQEVLATVGGLRDAELVVDPST